MHQGVGTRPDPVTLAVPGSNSASRRPAARASDRAAKTKQSVGVRALKGKSAHPAGQWLGRRTQRKAATLTRHQTRRPQTTP
eukprot:scaffold2645_cov499-Pavlova_lutheri.AAC.1